MNRPDFKKTCFEIKQAHAQYTHLTGSASGNRIMVLNYHICGLPRKPKLRDVPAAYAATLYRRIN